MVPRACICTPKSTNVTHTSVLAGCATKLGLVRLASTALTVLSARGGTAVSGVSGQFTTCVGGREREK
jgi:hypothetical protein